MKKYAMLVVKGIIGLLPLSLKNALKKNSTLTELYSRSLQRSGLFYGFPSKKKRMAMYRHFLVQQESYVSAITASIDGRVDLVVLGKDGLEITLNSLGENTAVSNIFVVAKSLQFVNGPKRCLNHVSTLDELFKSGKLKNSLMFVNSGDELHSKSLIIMNNMLKEHAAVYCDTDKKDKNSTPIEPEFYPEWNPELQFSTGYIKTGLMLSEEVADRLKQQDSLSNTETIAELVVYLWLTRICQSFGHVSNTLVHRGEFTERRRLYSLDRIAQLVEKLAGANVVTHKATSTNEVIWPSLGEPLVSLIVPTKDARLLVKACIESILEKTTYSNFEILLIDNGSTEQESLEYFEFLNQHKQVRVLKYPGPFNYSAINNFGVKNAKGSVIGLINNDIEVISPDWLAKMVGHALREDIGCVGAKLLYSDGRIQHAGVVLGYGGGAGHAHKYFPRYHSGYLHRLTATNSFSAVTAACLIVKRRLFEEVSGLNEQDLTVAFNDVDFCLRVRAKNVRNVYCAEAELYHHESVSRGLDIAPEKAARFEKELNYLQTTWQAMIQADPAYSRNLTLKRENFAMKEKEEYTQRQVF